MSKESEAKSPIMVTYVTVSGHEEARRLARSCVAARLCACANILPGALSVYEWQGELHEDNEQVVFFKCPRDGLALLHAHIKKEHSYECPCITSWPVAEGHAPYLEWVRQKCATDKLPID